MKGTFFCEACGASVDRGADSCPSCGRSFLGVRCPRCGREGTAGEFRRGCPSCGYTPGGQERAAEPVRPSRPVPPEHRRRPDWPASRWWLLSGLLAIFIGLLLFLWNRT